MIPIPGKRYFIRYTVVTYANGCESERDTEIDSRVCISVDEKAALFRSGYSSAYISLQHASVISEDTRTWWQRMTT